VSESLALVIVIAIVFTAVVIAATVFALFPLVRQIQSLLSRIDALIQSTEGDVRLTVSELREAVRNLNQISAAVQKDMGKLSDTIEALEGFGQMLQNTSDVIRTAIHPRVLSFAAALVGLKTGSRYLLRRVFLKKILVNLLKGR
jgi:predicted PurR-regulated permease PerM